MPIISPTRKRNALWPLQRGPKGWKTGALATRYTSAIRHLLRTPIGSIVWAPVFGTRLHLFRTQAINEEDETLLAGEIGQAVRTWIPDITLLAVEFDSNPDSETLEITVSWGVSDASVAVRSSQPAFAFGPVNQTVTL